MEHVRVPLDNSDPEFKRYFGNYCRLQPKRKISDAATGKHDTPERSDNTQRSSNASIDAKLNLIMKQLSHLQPLPAQMSELNSKLNRMK